MNDPIVRPLSYEEQLQKSHGMMRDLLSLPIIKIEHFRQIRDLQEKLRDRIKKQEEKK